MLAVTSIIPVAMICDNKAKCHDPFIVEEDMNAMRVICKECKHQYVIRKDPFKGVPENRSYIKVFRRLTLQPNTNLFYKYYPSYLQ